MHSFSYKQVAAREWRRSGWILVNGAWMVNSTPPPPPPSCLLSAAQSHTMAFYVTVQLQPIRFSGLPLDSAPPSGLIYSSAHSVCACVQRAAAGLERQSTVPLTNTQTLWEDLHIHKLRFLSWAHPCCCVSCILALRWDAPLGTSPASRRQQQPQPWRDSHKKEDPKSPKSFRP